MGSIPSARWMSPGSFILLRANTNNGLLLVNGSPAIVNAEDLQLLDQKGMEQSFQFQDLQNQFPKVGVWPGDRDGTTWPNTQPGPNGGVQFILGYPLINGCHACAHAGIALFTWNFDAQGKFLGTTFHGTDSGSAAKVNYTTDWSHTPAAATPS